MPSTKNGDPITLGSPSALKSYFLASRPKTWIASVSPVLIGAAMAPAVHFGTLFLTLLFSLLIQIGTNFANDLFDFLNGADTRRSGPKRATQEGWVSPFAMGVATFLVFGAAFLIAIPLMILAGPWSLFVAAACIAFGIFYTAGPKPLGYLGLGEPLVLIFFGPVATCGTYFLQAAAVPLPVFIAGLAPGLLSSALLIANHLRDEKSDRAVKKWTLIARFGRTFGSWEYTLSLSLAALVPWALVFFYGAPLLLLSASLIFPLGLPAIRKVFTFRDPLELIAVLEWSAFLLIFYTALFCLFYAPL